MTAMITAAVVGVVGSAYNANQAKKEGKRARNAVSDSEANALAEQTRQYDQTREDWAPWMASGEDALGRMDSVQGGDMSAFNTSPGYQFRMDEGARNGENAFSNRGGGGNAMRAMEDYRQNMASSEFGNWWQRQSGMAGMGGNATGNVQNAGMNAANNSSSAYMRGGENRASIGLYGANEQANYLNQGLGAALYGIEQYAGRDKKPLTVKGGNGSVGPPAAGRERRQTEYWNGQDDRRIV